MARSVAGMRRALCAKAPLDGLRQTSDPCRPRSSSAADGYPPGVNLAVCPDNGTHLKAVHLAEVHDVEEGADAGKVHAQRSTSGYEGVGWPGLRLRVQLADQPGALDEPTRFPS
jgi:hypothetical protein